MIEADYRTGTRRLPAMSSWSWAIVLSLALAVVAQAQEVASASPSAESAAATSNLPGGSWPGDPAQLVERWSSPAGIDSAWKTMLALSVLSLAPAVLLMTTSFIRISVVLALLRQALGTQMLPSNQIITSLALFMTVLIMSPTWKQVYQQAIVPYGNDQLTAGEAWHTGLRPVQEFMSRQIERAGNGADVYLFFDHVAPGAPAPKYYHDVPIEALLPAFVLSELKTAFLIGFQIFLPFLVIDLVVASVTTSMGMMMLPPVMVSLPMKLLLFVLVDGWHLVVGMLLGSFGSLT